MIMMAIMKMMVMILAASADHDDDTIGGSDYDAAGGDYDAASVDHDDDAAGGVVDDAAGGNDDSDDDSGSVDVVSFSTYHVSPTFAVHEHGRTMKRHLPGQRAEGFDHSQRRTTQRSLVVDREQRNHLGSGTGRYLNPKGRRCYNGVQGTRGYKHKSRGDKASAASTQQSSDSLPYALDGDTRAGPRKCFNLSQWRNHEATTRARPSSADTCLRATSPKGAA